MLTLPKIEIRLKQIDKEKSECKIGDKEYKKLQKEFERIDFCHRYLSTNPRVEFINKEKVRLAQLLIKINDGFDKWRKWQNSGKTFKEYQDEYNRLNEVAKFKKQLKMLNFILDN